MRFSEITQAFYDSGYERNAMVDDLPADAKSITDEQYQQLYAAVNQTRHVWYRDGEIQISAVRPDSYHVWDGASGDWIVTDAAKQQQKMDLIANAELQKQQLINSAMQTISVIQLKLQAGRALNDVEKSRLDAALDYIDAIESIDTCNAPDIEWPVKPDA